MPKMALRMPLIGFDGLTITTFTAFPPTMYFYIVFGFKESC